jgi:DNA polymerase-1
VPIQGSNADLIKIVMIRLHHVLKETRMILQVHDGLVFAIPVEELDRAHRLIKAQMEGVGDGKLTVPIKVGKNRYEAEPME